MENPNMKEAPDREDRGLESQTNLTSIYDTKKSPECQMLQGREGNDGDFEDEFYGKLQNSDIKHRLLPAHIEDLRSSGLSDETIQDANLVTVSPEAAENYLGYDPTVPCLTFPYPPLREDPYYRFKPERPLVFGNGERRKYLAKKNGGNRLYIPPCEDLEDVIINTDRDLVITEGEKKALKAYQEGYTAAALSGVWSWKEKVDSETGKTRVIDELEAFKWQDRTVYIVFDSDAAENGAVQKAEDALGNYLCGRGARVLIARIPSEGAEKVGLDDSLVKEENEAFDRLLQAAMPPIGSYFKGKTFKPFLLAKELSARKNYMFAKDMEMMGGKLYVYKDGVYRAAGNVEATAQKLLGDEATPKRLVDSRKTLNNVVVTDIEQLNPYEDLINVGNGLLNPFTGELKDHTPGFPSTIQIPTSWNPDAQSEELDEFLDTICKEWKDAICELIGYLLIPKNFIKSFFVFPGKTDTGKTTLLNLITGMIGGRQCAEESLQALCDTSRQFIHAHLENKLLNVFDDMPANYIEDSSAIKVLTGGTPRLRIERKYEGAYYAPNFCRHIYACNELPRCADKTEAWYNRIQIFPFEHRLSKSEKKEGLRERFTTDKDLHEAMLVKAVEGLKRLKSKDWKLEGSREAKTQYKAKNDSVLAFISDCCEAGENKQIRRTEFREAYERWCDRTSAYKVQTAKKIYDRVRGEEQFDEKTLDGCVYFTGLGLKEE